MRHFLISQTAQALIAIMSLTLMIGCSESPPDATPTPASTPAPASTAAPVSPDSTATPTTDPAPQTPPAPKQGFPVPEKRELSLPTLDSVLDDLLSQVESGQLTETEAAARMPLYRDDSVAVTIHIPEDPKDVLDYLSDNGITPRHADEGYIEVFLTVRLLRETAKLSGVQRIEPIVPPRSNQSPPAQSVIGNGPAVHGSLPWNEAGFTGEGIKIGVIDLGFAGAAALLGAELPHSVESRCYVTESDSPRPLAECDQTAHGTIVAESIIDIAPHAALYLASVRSTGDLSEVVDWMIEEDVSIINMSLTWTYDGPGDGTSPFPNSSLNILSRAVDNGIVWISAAGNHAQSSWLGAPTDTDSDGLLEMDGNEQLNLKTHAPQLIQLRWAGDYTANSTDLDLHILNDQGDILTQSLNAQSGESGHHPREIAFTKEENTIVQVSSQNGILPAWIQVLVWGAQISQTNTTGSIGSPAESASPGMLAVGAVNWQRTYDIEGYSSRGPAPDGRTKPDLVAAACGETAHKGPGEIFCGTSQSAPHVTGIAALVRQHFPELNPREVVAYLTEHAEDRGDKRNQWGAGLSVLPPLPTPTPTPTAVSTPTPQPMSTPQATATPTPTPEPNFDREALEALYRATDGDNWRNNTNWMSDKPLSEWYGIKLNRDGRVEGLSLSRNLLTGEIPEAIGDLDNLKELSLSNNNLTGPIPLSMAALTELRTVRIFDNAGICEPTDPKFQKGMHPWSGHHLPSCRDDDRKIAFVSDRDSPDDGYDPEPNYEIYVMNADSTNQTRLTDSLGPDIQPAWSPDGTKIAFVAVRDDSANIYVMDADGSDQTRLTNMHAAYNLPTWSPDGQHIAFIIPQRQAHEIHVMNADGSNLTTLTTEATPRTRIAWSPDSKRLAYVAPTQRPKHHNTYRRPSYWQLSGLFTINRDGSNPTLVFESNVSIEFPVWMPEEDHLSIAFFLGNYPVALGGDTTVPLSTTESEGCNPIWLDHNNLGLIVWKHAVVWKHGACSDSDVVSPLVPLSARDSFPGCTKHWSPDGKLIAWDIHCNDDIDDSGFTDIRLYADYLNFYSSIYLVNADGTGKQRLTDNESNNFHPTFSPANGRPPSIWSKDSRQLLMSGAYSLFVLKADGGETISSPY